MTLRTKRSVWDKSEFVTTLLAFSKKLLQDELLWQKIINNLMKITAHTIIIFRINKKPNNSIINIYNRYFERVGLDAICLAPYNEDPRPLLSAMKILNIPGALTVAFEHDPRLIDQVDEWDESARQTKVTGFITQKTESSRPMLRDASDL